MAYYSNRTKLSQLPMMSNGAGTLSKDSYVLTEVTKIVTYDGYSDVTFKYSLYGKSTKQRSVKAELIAGGSVSKTVTVTTSMTCLLTLTETVTCYSRIETYISATLSYEDSSVTGGYGITTDPVFTKTTVSFVKFGFVMSYPPSLKYGETGTVTTDKSSDYRLEFYDTSGIKRFTTSFSGTSVDITIPATVFKEAGGNLTTMKCFEKAQGIDIAEVDYSCSVSETACSIGISAVRSSTDADPSLVTLTLVGESAVSSTSRTVTIYAKETSASNWTTLGTISPAETSFSETFTADLNIDYAWDIYAVLSDGYTSAESTKARIYSRSYIMDVRTDGKGIAFGGTAANADEMYCGFDTFRANKISAGDIMDGSGNVLADKADSSSLATVAKTGSYNDLTNKPSLPEITMQAGSVKLTPPTASTWSGWTHVDFAHDFPGSPNLTLQPITGAPDKCFIGIQKLDASGFDVRIKRTDGTTVTSVHWIACEKTQ